MNNINPGPEAVDGMFAKRINIVLTNRGCAPLRKIYHFYNDGFRNMTVGRSLWIIIAVKLVVMFGVLKLFFFPDLLATRFDNDDDRSDFVLEQLTTHANPTSPVTEGETHD